MTDLDRLRSPKIKKAERDQAQTKIDELYRKAMNGLLAGEEEEQDDSTTS